jgi:hypothetical protein
MTSHRALVVLPLMFVALLAGLAGRPPAAGATSRDDLMKTSVLALQGAVEKRGAAQMYVYPPVAMVAPQGGLEIAFWPRDPWTGGRLTPGHTRGHYTYSRAADRRSYRLIGYLSGGRTFVVGGRMAHTPMLAYDHRGKEGLNLIFEYVREWSLAHAAQLPSPAQVTRDGAVGPRRDGATGRPRLLRLHEVGRRPHLHARAAPGSQGRLRAPRPRGAAHAGGEAVRRRPSAGRRRPPAQYRPR